ncbi:uncharacterized protein C20orf204 homolog [Neomonachus schauinslandi]|uniref:Uncharacterized protein C20orf204 homolog n=1 Tax=Neomonachus schauinslandi TaxID=29088 RepID=A0A2Y9G3B9_NEOSC|nr:uncharacterized protein C20orf204 homolog [Neomonachus schauinslandi]
MKGTVTSPFYNSSEIPWWLSGGLSKANCRRACYRGGPLHRPGHPTLTQCPFQVPPKPALWALLLALLGMAPGQAGLRTCSVPDVLHHYRAVIFEDLQAAVRQGGPGARWTGPGSQHLHFIKKNLTGPAAPGWRGRVGASCSAQKEHSILLSIASLGRTLRRVVAGGRRGALEKAAWTVALRTEAVMRRHCWTLRQRSRWPERRRPRRRGSRRRLLLHALDAVATCWEKLFALRAAAAEDA